MTSFRSADDEDEIILQKRDSNSIQNGSLESLDLPSEEKQSEWIETLPSSRLTKDALMKYLDDVQSDMRKSFESSRQDDEDLFSRVTSVLSNDVIGGDINERLKKFGIDFDFLKADETYKEFEESGQKKLLSSLPKPGGGVTPRDAAKNLVKVCPECAEIAEVNARDCAECGFLLADVHPVPCKKRLSDKSTSYNHSLQPVSDSTEFVYDEPKQPALESIANDIRAQLSLNLRGSHDSSIQGDSGTNKPCDDFSFEYLADKSVASSSLPPELRKELSLNLSSPSSVSVTNDESRSVDNAPLVPVDNQNNEPSSNDFVNRLIVDPRFRPQSAENQSSSALAKPSKLKRPKSAQSKPFPSRLYQSMNPDNYQRRWETSSGIRSSSDFALRNKSSKRPRPKSAAGNLLTPAEGKKPRPLSAGFSRALLSLSQEDLSQIKDSPQENTTGNEK